MENSNYISIQGNTAELSIDLFGLGEKEPNPEFIKYPGENARRINTSATIVEGITLGQPSYTNSKKQWSLYKLDGRN